jgi:DNA-binding response OmpR family regulator
MLVDDESASLSRVGAGRRVAVNILVVEDDWLLASELAETLAGAGFGVVGPAGSVELALAAMSTSAVDAALLDINLGGERRVFDLGRILMALHVPFAFLTGYSQGLMPTDLRDRPRLRKPFDKQEVLGILQQISSAAVLGR